VARVPPLMATVELVFAVIGVWVVLASVAATLFCLVARGWSGRARTRRTLRTPPLVACTLRRERNARPG